MSMRYKGAVLSATAPVTSSSSAKGIWTMRQQLQAVGGTGWPIYPPWPVANIGDAYGGGFFGGQINVSGVIYNLVVSPKANEASGKTFGVYGSATGFTSAINGTANSAGEAALGASYQAATFCEGLTIGGYSDWYLPAKNELEVLYYYLKPTTDANSAGNGSNANAVSPEPVNTAYTSSIPAQTTSVNFKSGGVQAFVSNFYWSSSEDSSIDPLYYAWDQTFTTGFQYRDSKNTGWYVRAVRRVLA